jgi:hypothetical protein
MNVDIRADIPKGHGNEPVTGFVQGSVVFVPESGTIRRERRLSAAQATPIARHSRK